MNNGVIIDAVFALVLLLGAIFGAKRGLFRSLMGLATIVLALIGAVLIADLVSQPVTGALMPHVEESVGEWFRDEAEQEDPAAEAEEATAPEEEEEITGATGLLKKLLRFDLDGAVREELKKSAQEAALAAVRSLLGSVVRTLLFLVSFLLLTLALKLLTRGLDKVFSLPVLHTLNSLGGGALGLIESALLLFLVCTLAPKLGISLFEEYKAGTYLLAFFMDRSPRSLAAALLSKS